MSCSGAYFPVGPEAENRTASSLSLGITSATVSCLVVPNPLLTDVGAGISTSAGNSTSSTETVSGRDSISGFTAKLWLSSTCDLRTMEVTSARLTSPERVTTAVGTSSRVAGTKSDALAGRLRHTLRCGFSSVIYFRSAKQGGVIKRTQIGKQTPALVTSAMSLLSNQMAILTCTYESCTTVGQNRTEQNFITTRKSTYGRLPE